MDRAAIQVWRMSLLVVGLLVPAQAQANIGPRWWGDRVAEPIGLGSVAIAHEQLTIDLRPLAQVEPARVEVVYQLSNGGAPKKLDLLFISGAAAVSEFQVRLGDQLLKSTPLSMEERFQFVKEEPKEWKTPTTLPGISGKETYIHQRSLFEEGGPVAFSVTLPSGASTLRVCYRTRAAGADEYYYPTTTWQFPYILAPARAWASFGGLDVTVYLPAGWQSASEPALEREGDTLRGSFSSLPADVLSVAARVPVGPEFERTIHWYTGLYVLAVLGGGGVCWLAGRTLGRYRARRTQLGSRAWQRAFDWRIALLAFLTPLLWAALLQGAMILGEQGVFAVLGEQVSPYYHEALFGPICGHCLLTLFILPTGFILTWGNGRRAFERGLA
jgi:hypothetical protein